MHRGTRQGYDLKRELRFFRGSTPFDRTLLRVSVDHKNL